MRQLVEDELAVSAKTISNIDADKLIEIADVMIDVIRGGNQIVFMGNGGSSADAQHIAAEFSGRYLLERPAMAGVCLSNIAPVTAIGNDYSYDIVFRRQVEAFCRKGDAVVGLSTSGNSKNVILAFEKAKEMGCITISVTGNGGAMKEMADYALVIPSKETPRIQEGYICACHTICGLVERGIYGKKAVFIDRDDTIVYNVPYCNDPDDLHMIPGVPEAISRLNSAGYLTIIITNQSGIGRGKLDESMLTEIHDKMVGEIVAGGGRIDDIFYCPHHPDDKCSCRKPEIGMGIAAVKKHGIDTRSSYMIGNSDADMLFGERLGCKCLKVTEDHTFADAVDTILGE